MSQNFYIDSRSKHGKCVFARRDIRRLENIFTFSGRICYFTDTSKDSSIEYQSLQILVDRYIITDSPGRYINHSCYPNSGLKDAVTLIAIKDINADEEIVFDYSTCMDEDYWTMKCNCESKNCRGIIKDFKYLPNEIKERYIKLGIVPEWILDNVGSYRG